MISKHSIAVVITLVFLSTIPMHGLDVQAASNSGASPTEQSPQGPYYIAGRIRDSSGNGIPGVSVTVGIVGTVRTDSNGNYGVLGLNAGTYVVIPNKGGYTFSPYSRTITLPPAVDNVNFTASGGSVPTQEQAALVALYTRTNGPNWIHRDGWLGPLGACSWYGVSCDGPHVVTLYLPENNLTGSLPTELGNLSELNDLELSKNHLSGAIPASLSRLTKLTGLSLTENELTGGIPDALGSLGELRQLDLAENRLTGSIPPSLGSLGNLEGLWLYNNLLTGAIPAQLGNLTRLRWLSLSTNRLTGGLPSSLQSLFNLEWFIAANNQLSGTIPRWLGNLRQLTLLELGSNRFTGSIPSELGNLSSLASLDLSGNSLAGGIPESLGSLANLHALSLSAAGLTGSIPAGLSNLTNLTHLKLDDNLLTGELLPQLGNLHNLYYFDTSGNTALTGPIPVEFTSLAALEYFFLVDTSICMPNNSSVQTWFANISHVSGGTTGCDSVSPGPIADLQLSPGPSSGQVVLAWTAPGDDGATGGPAIRYDIRYGSLPIDATNWQQATQVSGEPTPASPGSRQIFAVSSVPIGARWYWAMKTRDDSGNWSVISNGPALQDVGFRPSPNGYSFDNWSNLITIPPSSSFTADEVVRMFGPEQACVVQTPICILRPTLDVWRLEMNRRLYFGHCLGMSYTSSNFFMHPDAIPPFGANTTFALPFSDRVRRENGFYSVKQWTYPLQDTLSRDWTDPSSALVEIQRALSTGVLEPPVLAIGGHAVIPFAIEQLGNRIYRIWVYDNNLSSHMDQQVRIDLNNNTWQYLSASGDAQSRSIAVIEPSAIDEPARCDWCGSGILAEDKSGTSLATQFGEVWLAGQGQLLITDSQARRIGHVGNQLVNEIPGARWAPIIGGLGIDSEPTYRLPLDGDFSVQVTGVSTATVEFGSVFQFGPGFSVSANQLTLTQGRTHGLTIEPDGSGISYLAFGSENIEIVLTSETPETGYEFRIGNANAIAGHELRLVSQPTDQILRVGSAAASATTYDLAIVRIGTQGRTEFDHRRIELSQGDTHWLDYGEMNTSDTVALGVDQGSDGTIDYSIVLDNRSYPARLFMPLVARGN